MQGQPAAIAQPVSAQGFRYTPGGMLVCPAIPVSPPSPVSPVQVPMPSYNYGMISPAAAGVVQSPYDQTGQYMQAPPSPISYMQQY